MTKKSCLKDKGKEKIMPQSLSDLISSSAKIAGRMKKKK
jgi:hypothetical protein